ncbi:nicotinate phosphoribosyltransferase isoform X3 [Drosophila subobscura]|uniref:nicotinate phosphoribosyltransferase isoform X3 n=1 Tax=Drosophila subobscura TaxID=7241 RepID=UPI00155A41CB|nr:nicotinate phosphoribosyltransferase isoform X3 [Drosophila subobscura]
MSNFWNLDCVVPRDQMVAYPHRSIPTQVVLMALPMFWLANSSTYPSRAPMPMPTSPVSAALASSRRVCSSTSKRVSWRICWSMLFGIVACCPTSWMSQRRSRVRANWRLWSHMPLHFRMDLWHLSIRTMLRVLSNSRETEQQLTQDLLSGNQNATKSKDSSSPSKPQSTVNGQKKITNGKSQQSASNGHKTHNHNGHQNGIAAQNIVGGGGAIGGSRTPLKDTLNETNLSTTTATTRTRTSATAATTLTRTTSNGTAYLPKYVEKSFRSGLLNFSAVALALNDLGYHALGIRIDSGDLAYLSCLARETFEKVAERFKVPWFNKLTIVASNDINEDTILSLNEQGHKIDCFGIGTHLVTCQRQPALGCVYKLVEINGQPRIKLSQDVEKVTMPGNKNAYRLYSADGHALIDLLQKVSEPPPAVGQKVLCRHPFQESKRAYVIPSHVESLYKVYWKSGKICQQLPTLEQVREKVQISLKTLRNDHKRTLNPTPYKVSVSDNLYNFIHDLWLQNAPIGELS